MQANLALCVCVCVSCRKRLALANRPSGSPKLLGKIRTCFSCVVSLNGSLYALTTTGTSSLSCCSTIQQKTSKEQIAATASKVTKQNPAHSVTNLGQPLSCRGNSRKCETVLR
eukprot:scaffold12163_cov176-Amphora_coffeaeformis.AAC.6